MDEWKIPALAITVVQNGEVPLVRAYDLRDVEAGLKATADTQFPIGSITKSFTATGLALLLDERRVDWKKPVREYIPEFRLYDVVATDRIMVRDLLCHHSGLPRHDWIWLPGDLSPAQMLAAMRYLEPSDDIRTTFQYFNLSYLVTSMVSERVTGQSWTEFTRARLTDKLHMDVTFTVEDLAAAADAAVPYAMDGDTRLRVKRWPILAADAGGTTAAIASFTNWLRLHLDHGGRFVGCGTLMTMLPDHGVGVAVFTNRNPSAVPDILANYVFDRVCGKEPIPWLDHYRERRRKLVAQLNVDRQARKATRRPNTRPSRDLVDYAGDYAHPGYGPSSPAFWRLREFGLSTALHRNLQPRSHEVRCRAG